MSSLQPVVTCNHATRPGLLAGASVDVVLLVVCVHIIGLWRSVQQWVGSRRPCSLDTLHVRLSTPLPACRKKHQSVLHFASR